MDIKPDIRVKLTAWCGDAPILVSAGIPRAILRSGAMKMAAKWLIKDFNVALQHAYDIGAAPHNTEPRQTTVRIEGLTEDVKVPYFFPTQLGRLNNAFGSYVLASIKYLVEQLETQEKKDASIFVRVYIENDDVPVQIVEIPRNDIRAMYGGRSPAVDALYDAIDPALPRDGRQPVASLAMVDFPIWFDFGGDRFKSEFLRGDIQKFWDMVLVHRQTGHYLAHDTVKFTVNPGHATDIEFTEYIDIDAGAGQIGKLANIFRSRVYNIEKEAESPMCYLMNTDNSARLSHTLEELWSVTDPLNSGKQMERRIQEILEYERRIRP